MRALQTHAWNAESGRGRNFRARKSKPSAKAEKAIYGYGRNFLLAHIHHSGIRHGVTVLLVQEVK